jgi:hypothetical protein
MRGEITKTWVVSEMRGEITKTWVVGGGRGIKKKMILHYDGASICRVIF